MIQRIIQLSEMLVESKREVEELEDKLRQKKSEMLRLEREDLPQLFAELGMTEIKLQDGSVVTIKEDCDAKITEKTREKAFEWLMEHNYGGLIKTQVAIEFPRGDREQALHAKVILEEQFTGVFMKEDVHHSTLKAFVKECLEKGEGIPMDLFNVYPFSKAVLKKGDRS